MQLFGSSKKLLGVSMPAHVAKHLAVATSSISAVDVARAVSVVLGVVSVSGGTPTLTLNDGGTASYAGNSSSNALTFSYTVAAGEGHVVTLTLNMSETVSVAGGTPTLTLNDGGAATYTGGSGTSALTFSYTVAAGQSTPDLGVTAFNLKGATVADGAKNIADLTHAVINPAAGVLQIDTAPPAPPVIATDIANQNKTVILTGTAEAGSTITMYEKQSALGQINADPSGAWSFTTIPLSNGVHTFVATATDAAGNISALSKSVDPVVNATIVRNRHQLIRIDKSD